MEHLAQYCTCSCCFSTHGMPMVAMAGKWKYVSVEAKGDACKLCATLVALPWCLCFIRGSFFILRGEQFGTASSLGSWCFTSKDVVNRISNQNLPWKKIYHQLSRIVATLINMFTVLRLMRTVSTYLKCFESKHQLATNRLWILRSNIWFTLRSIKSITAQQKRFGDSSTANTKPEKIDNDLPCQSHTKWRSFSLVPYSLYVHLDLVDDHY